MGLGAPGVGMCPPVSPGRSHPSAHVGMPWGEAAPIPMPSYGDPAPDLAMPLGATVMQMIHNYANIKPVNNRYSASPTQNNTSKKPPEHRDLFPCRFGLISSHTPAPTNAPEPARRAPERGRRRAALASWEEQSLAEGYHQKQKNWPKLLFHP